MEQQQWAEVLADSLQDIWLGVIEFLPALIVAIIIFIIGIVLGAIVNRVLAKLIDSLKVDSLLKGTGFEQTLNKAGINLNSGAFVGALFKWFVVIVFLIASLEIVGLHQVNEFLREVVLGYLPQVIVAALVLILASLISDAMKKLVTSGAKAANIKSANLLGGITYTAIWVFAVIIALSHLGIASSFMQILFTGVVAMLSLAGGLAFGLGGRDAASRLIEKVSRHTTEE